MTMRKQNIMLFDNINFPEIQFNVWLFLKNLSKSGHFLRKPELKLGYLFSKTNKVCPPKFLCSLLEIEVTPTPHLLFTPEHAKN